MIKEIAKLAAAAAEAGKSAKKGKGKEKEAVSVFEVYAVVCWKQHVIRLLEYGRETDRNKKLGHQLIHPIGLLGGRYCILFKLSQRVGYMDINVFIS